MDLLRHTSLITLISFVFVSAGLFVGCDVAGNSGIKNREVKMTLTTGSENSFSTSGTTTQHWDRDTSNVELTEVKMLLDDLELENVSDDSLDFEVDNMVVSLPLDNDTLELTSQEIPVGYYDELDIEIDSDVVDDPDLNNEDGRFSIVAKGTYNGEEFTFRTNKEFEEEFRFDPPIQITDSTTTVQLNLSIYLDRWFKHADPTNPDDQQKIEYNIRKSFNIFCRNDDDGWRHHEHDGDGKYDDDHDGDGDHDH